MPAARVAKGHRPEVTRGACGAPSTQCAHCARRPCLLNDGNGYNVSGPRGASCQAAGKLVRIIMIGITAAFYLRSQRQRSDLPSERRRGRDVCGKIATAMSHGILETIYNKYASTFHSKKQSSGDGTSASGETEKQQRQEREERAERGRGAARWKN